MATQSGGAKVAREGAIRGKLPADILAIVEATATDPGAPFEPEALARLREVRAADPAAWARFREAMKGAVPLAELDRLTAPAGGEGDGKQGRPVEWDDPEPCADEVDGAELISGISAFIRRHVWIDEPSADALALWVPMTWIHDRLDISTFVNLTSATKRCGKSLLLELLGELVYRRMMLSGPTTEAVLFRMVEAHAPTLMLDEADTYLRHAEGLRGVVNGSQRRALAYIARCVGEDNEVRRFATFCPKLIAGIGGIPDTVRDRSLVVRLERKPASERVPPWRERDRDAVNAMRAQIARWTGDHAARIVATLPAVTFPNALHDRARDAWESLLAIANVAGGGWPGRAWKACEHFAATSGGDEDGAREMLLGDLYDIFEAADWPEGIPSATIVERLVAMESRPWPEWKRGKQLTMKALGDLLKPFEIKPRQLGKQADGSNRRGYHLADFRKDWASYFPERVGIQSAIPLQPRETRVIRDSQPATEDFNVADANVTKPLETGNCSGVAVRNPGSGGNGVKGVQLPPQPLGTMTTGDAYRRARDGE